MRWYVEPVAAHQRTFNSASSRSSTSSRSARRRTSARLERRLDALEERLGREHPNRADENRRLRAAGPVRARRDGDPGRDARRGAPERATTRSSSSESRSSGTPGHDRFARRSSGGWSTSRRRRDVPIDLVIATKFPSYAIRHPNKVVWLVHQFRQAYDLDRTELGQFGEDPFDRATVRAIQRLDRTTLGEARRLFAISRQRRRAARALDGPRRRGARAAAAAARLPDVRRRRRRSSSPSAGSTARSGSTCCSRRRRSTATLQVVVAGDGPDRERLEQLAPSAASTAA